MTEYVISDGSADSGAAVLAYFSRKLNSYSASYANFADPANKNRLQAVSMVRDRLPDRLNQDFESAKQELIDIVLRCQEDFDPYFDTEYGTGRPVFVLLLGELASLKALED